ncbi:Hypothetical protein A7982_10909 [Minicystis rosea]|nr:Hypothetical protein A7982_10909 [Minicystis rosea]
MRHVSCGLLLLIAASACGNTTPLHKDSSPIDAASAAAPTSAPVPPPNVTAAAPSAEAAATATAAPAASAVPADKPADAPIVADNKVEPTEGPELQERAKALLDAIAKDEPERGESFWFPKEPFIPLKDIKDPGKYWSQLHRTYANDIHALHKKRKIWDKVEFVSFEGWSHPKWVKPGDEANKIGYHRAFHGKLRYKADGEAGEIDVHTIITWQGHWYCTHLRKFKK